MRRMIACLLTLPLAVCVTPILAQEPLADSDKAVAAFDIYLDRLTDSDVAKATGMDDPTKALPMAPTGDMDMKEVRRIFGAVSAPADAAVVQNRQGTDPLPMNFFVRVQFRSEEAALKAFQGMAQKGQQVTLNGQEYYRPPADDGETPGNMLLHMVSPDMMELGTDGFVLQSSRHVFTDNLLASWQKMPKAAIRIAADLDGARHLIDQGLQAAKANGIPAPAMPAVAVVENAAGVRFALDFSSESLLWLTVSGKDAGGTGTIKNTLDGLLAMGKGIGQQSLPNIPAENLKQVAGTMLDALATTQDGNDVNLVLPRPEGFEAAIGEVVPLVMGAMMGGMGGPGGPGGGDPFGGDALGGKGEEDPFGAAPEPAAAVEDPFGGDPLGN